MIKFQFLTDKRMEKNNESNIVIFFILEGEIKLKLEDEGYELKKDDFIVINPEKNHSYIARNDVLIGKLSIDRIELKKLLKNSNVIFWCNSTLDDGEKYDEIRSVLKKICNYHYSNKNKSQLFLISLYYDFLSSLATNFLITEEDEHYSTIVHKNEERKQKIEDYIYENFDKEISLNDLSEKLYLSNAYLSKYIKKQFGMSFLECVNKVRLDHAIEGLIYSDKPVVRIAVDCGFSSSAAFNKAFKEKYNTTPSLYRVNWKGNLNKDKNKDEKKEDLDNKLITYYQNHMLENEEEYQILQRKVKVCNNGKADIDNKCKLINIGAAADLLHSDMQEHILRLKEKLGIRYVRFWDLYSSEMFLNDHSEGKKYNFTKLNRIIDFLVNNGMIPYIELGVKTKKLIKKYKVLLYQKSEENIFKTKESLRYFIYMLVKNLINRYGIEEIKKWYFEYWRIERDSDSCLMADISDIEEYLDCFDIVAGEMRKYVPNIKIGGYGISLRYGEEDFKESLKMWQKRKEQPNFISLYCYPYPGEKGSSGKKPELSMDQNYVKNYICKSVKIIKDSGIKVDDIHISEWSFTVSNRNKLNDSCIKGAYLTKNIIDVIDLEGIKMIGYWIGSDLFADFYDSSEFLNGSGGLLTRDGIEKPSYYAFNFINRLEGSIVKKGENYIVTSDGNGNYKIACHNFKNFNYQYCIKDEDELDIEIFNELLEDNSNMKIDFDFEVPKDGRYLIRIHSVSRKYGSIQDEWINMGKPEEITQEDISYLSRVTIPHISVKYIEARGNKLEFSVGIEANEINYIEITYLY